MGSKYLDLGFAVILAVFAYTRFANEQYGFAALFVVLSLMNFFTAYLKHNKAREEIENK